MLASIHGAEAVIHEVKVGTQTIRIPTPESFERIDGINAQHDELTEQFISRENRYVINFATPAAVAALRKGTAIDSPRNLNAQTMRTLEIQPVTPVQFETLRAQAETDINRLSKRLDAVLNKVVSAGSKSLSEKLQDNVEVKIGDPVPLGVFDRTRDSLGFAMMFKSNIVADGKDTAGLSVVAAMIVRVKDRVLYLYATSERKSDADEAWVKTTVKKWRDAIFAANGQTDTAASSGVSRVLQQLDFQRILLLALAGATASLAVYYFRRPKPSTPPSS